MIRERLKLEGKYIACLAHNKEHPYKEIKYGKKKDFRDYVLQEYFQAATVVYGSEEITEGKPMLLFFTLGQHKRPFKFVKLDYKGLSDYTSINYPWWYWRADFNAMKPDFKQTHDYVSF